MNTYMFIETIIWWCTEILMIALVLFIMTIPFLLPLLMCMMIVVKWNDDTPSRHDGTTDLCLDPPHTIVHPVLPTGHDTHHEHNR